MRSIETTLTRAPAAPAAPRATRDATIDAVRAGCLLVVVVLHALMVGVDTDATGALRTSVALAGEGWFVPVTWLMQVMPLFFIAGGYVSLMQWRRMRARGATAGDYIVGRVRRLVAPALVMIGVVGVALLMARLMGADHALLAEASLRIGQPLWFLAAYLGVTALVPVMAALHERRPLLTLLALGGGVLTVDVLSGEWGTPVGYLNLVLVWPLMQQLGFAMLDGACASWSRTALIVGAGSAVGLILLLIGLGWSPDMLVNLNPPTTAIALLGTAQFFALRLFRPRLDAVTGAPAVARWAEQAGAWAMGVYLWHMPLMLGLVATMWAVGLPLPAPHSAAWWATRIPWLLAILLIVVPFAALIVRLDGRVLRVVETACASAGSTASRVRGWIGSAPAWASVVPAIGGTTVALLCGVDRLLPFAASVLLLGLGLARASYPRYSRTP